MTMDQLDTSSAESLVLPGAKSIDDGFNSLFSEQGSIYMKEYPALHCPTVLLLRI